MPNRFKREIVEGHFVDCLYKSGRVGKKWVDTQVRCPDCGILFDGSTYRCRSCTDARLHGSTSYDDGEDTVETPQIGGPELYE